MKAGFYQVDITPPIGSERAGSYHKTYLEDVHDPLQARAAVFEDGARRVAIVGLRPAGLTTGTEGRASARPRAGYDVHGFLDLLFGTDDRHR